MRYFAYGSNMSLSRLRERVPSAQRIGVCTLREHALRFHKASRDLSAKCDAFYTQNPQDFIIGVLFKIDPLEKIHLDRAEGLGHAYQQKLVVVKAADGKAVTAMTYYALKIDPSLKPYSWYKNHVLIGARESVLPDSYIHQINAIECMDDPDAERDAMQRAIYYQG